MKLQLFSRKPNRRKAPKRPWLIVRQVVGDSMLPTLKPEHLVVAYGRYGALQSGDVVVFRHQGLEKIKRIQDITGEYIYFIGDNLDVSTDSRDFGSLHHSAVIAKVVWPRTDVKIKSPSM